MIRTSYLDSLMANNDHLSNKTERQWHHSLVETVERLYMQFLLVTTLYVMEPWERCLMISIFLLVISLVTYSAIVFIPFHVHNILQSAMPSLTDVFVQ
ncbi:hypothetical protein I4U23_013360 [Adineta vaga]|nr:hypothetical protein I4U23_013360 [Adineta vaga]